MIVIPVYVYSMQIKRQIQCTLIPKKIWSFNCSVENLETRSQRFHYLSMTLRGKHEGHFPEFTLQIGIDPMVYSSL